MRPFARQGQVVSWPALAVLGALALVFIVLGHDGRRVWQVALLILAVFAWMRWPLQSPVWAGVRRVAAFVTVMLCVLDGSVRAYLWALYQAAPDSSLVLAAVANTHVRESEEYLAMNWRMAALMLTAWLVLGGGIWYCTGRTLRQSMAQGARHMAVWVLIVVVCTAAYGSKPWRRLHPLNFWVYWMLSVDKMQDDWSNLEGMRQHALTVARHAQPMIASSGASTVLVVLTESVVRDNLSLYGYPRPTTPDLQAQQQELGDQMLVLRNAWSVNASTLPAVNNLFWFGAPGQPDALHLVALARAAGYKTWWISNQADIALEHQHARQADVFQMINRTRGRSTAMLDEEMQDELGQALQAPEARKFIVVHMQGAHPHYRLRFPEGRHPFDEMEDSVDADLERQGRYPWVRSMRNDYDAAVHYNDAVVARMMQMTREATGRGKAAVVYLSDHGQDVGHTSNHVGHSPTTPQGYRIPAVIWQSGFLPALPQDVGARPFRADWGAWTIARLLELRWRGQDASRDVLSTQYRWEAPTLPVKVKSFTD
ncbi:sulfatase [Comamonas serinivorans]|uniref:Sulfatase n=1 Tax=Comamonas serinivorans TaxID=1082851 RepID=A0A1Y0EU23_9BURK|nr:phosphoethanolamine transferase [Comamonas serinivorans]ARU06822.1 sulfatase [Comamonas serinivorans]